MAFQGPEGEHFFRSTLVQTLFYGVFAAFWERRAVCCGSFLKDRKITTKYKKIYTNVDKGSMRKERGSVAVAIVFFVFSLLSVTSAYGSTINAGISTSDSFLKSWTDTHPDITTTATLDFKTVPTNYYLDPSAASGDFAWDGTGVQPAYTMDPSGSLTQYAGHVGGSTSILSIANQSFDPTGNGKNFLTWLVDVPSLGTTDTIHFDLTSEVILSKSSTATTKNLSLNLIGYATDDLNHWSSSYSILNITVTENISGSNYNYYWSGTWTSSGGPSSVPEPSTIVLLGLGMTFISIYYVLGRKAGSGSGAGLSIIL